MPKVPLTIATTVVNTNVAVSSAAGGAGAAFSDTTTNSAEVSIYNSGSEDVEFKVDSGAWQLLEIFGRATLDVNLSTQALRFRKVANAGDGAVVVSVTSLTSAASAGDEASDMNSLPVNTQTGAAYTLVAADAGRQVDRSNASPNTCTIPTHAVVPFPVGTVVWVCMTGAGITTIDGAGVTLVKPAAKSLAISAQYEMARLHKVAVNTWRVNAS